MEIGERDRLLELRKTIAGTEAQTAVTKLLYDEPAVYRPAMTFTIQDPLLELGEYAEKGPHGIANFLAEAVIAELAPEWFSQNSGASWWVNEYNQYSGATNLMTRVAVESPFDESEIRPRVQDRDVTNGPTFATVEAGLEWALNYIKANADDVRELLDDEL